MGVRTENWPRNLTVKLRELSSAELDQVVDAAGRKEEVAATRVQEHLARQDKKAADRWLNVGWSLHRVRLLARAVRWERAW